MFKMRPYFNSLLALVYPDACIVCNHNQKVRGELFCLPCLCELPFTATRDWKNNDFYRHFEGRVKLEKTHSVFILTQGGNIEKMIYKLKYHGQPKLAVSLGIFSAGILMQDTFLEGVDYLVPVPLHPKKMRKRGYNQSEKLALGIRKKTGIKLELGVLLRKKNTKTQTKMKRYERLKNTEDAFVIQNGHKFTGKHILLLDDVLTTGSTLEACARALEEIKGIKISMLTLAIGII